MSAKALAATDAELAIAGEVVVADNGSTDRSREIAEGPVPGLFRLPSAATVPL